MSLNNIDESYKPLYTSKKRYFFMTGGRGSLKSHSTHDFILRLTYEVGEGILFSRYTMSSAEKSIIPEFKKAIERLGLEADFHVTRTHIINLKTNSFIWFTGIKASSKSNTGNLKSLSGITTWVIEEGEDFIDEAEFDRINKSIRSKAKQNRVIWVMNPTTIQHFIHGKWIKGHEKYIEIDGFSVLVSNHPKVEHIHTTYLLGVDYLDDDWLEEAYVCRYRAKKGVDPYTKKTLTEIEKENSIKEYVNTYLGGWLEKAEGVIFDDWEIGTFDESLTYIYGADWGFKKDPSTLVKVAIDNKKMLLYVKQELYAHGMKTPQFIEHFKSVCGDSLIVADNSELRLINEIRREDINIHQVVKLPGSIVAGIKKIQRYKIIVCGDSPEIIKELNNYCWVDKGTKTLPIDDWNHMFCDPVRYALTRLIP